MLCKSTDNLIDKIKHDVYEDSYEIKVCLILSRLSRRFEGFDSVNKKVIGEMKDEIKGKIMNKYLKK